MDEIKYGDFITLNKSAMEPAEPYSIFEEYATKAAELLEEIAGSVVAQVKETTCLNCQKYRNLKCEGIPFESCRKVNNQVEHEFKKRMEEMQHETN